ncbi:synaptotagmin-15 [Paragonimus westermani]|uniref:Synaptotagmin-15 n=1 Tax=Paragonimus westermani TaxID=34504 RepID=A0A5J4NMS3_9TREM|nr:synaptotagmin-15 [Paragonimus westermani]
MLTVQGRHLGKLDPTLYLSEEGEELYDIPPGHLGRIWFTVAYSRASELLTITVHKARNLRQCSLAGGASFCVTGAEQTGTENEDSLVQDFRVKIFLEQNERKYHMTTVKKQMVNPNFNEQFSFQVAAYGIGQQALRLQVLGYDKRRRCRLIGYTSFSLATLDTASSDNVELRTFRDIQLDTEEETSENPQLFVALTYFPMAERLIVGLFDCRNLPLRENGLPVDIFAKVILHQGLQGKEIKTKRTELLGNREGFDESFVFQKIPDPASVNVRIILVQHGFLDKQLCFVVLGGELVSKGRALLHWQSMIERPEQRVCEWQELQLY